MLVSMIAAMAMFAAADTQAAAPAEAAKPAAEAKAAKPKRVCHTERTPDSRLGRRVCVLEDAAKAPKTETAEADTPKTPKPE